MFNKPKKKKKKRKKTHITQIHVLKRDNLTSETPTQGTLAVYHTKTFERNVCTR